MPALPLSLLLSGFAPSPPDALEPGASTDPPPTSAPDEPAPFEPAPDGSEPRLGPPSPPVEPVEPVPPDSREPLPPADMPSEQPPAQRDDVDAVEPAPEGEGADAEPEELSLEDVFGTASDRDLPSQADGPGQDRGKATPSATTTGAAAKSVPAPRTRHRFWDKLDTRFRIITSAYLDVHRTDEPGFGRNENRLEFAFTYTPNRHIQIVGDIEAVFFGLSQAQELDDLATRQMLAPFHFESDAAYVAIYDLVPDLDIKVGRQIVVWGTADKFSPTNNINPDDLEDRPLFTEPIANQMVVVDYAPLADKLWFQGIYVPLFYPALLPPSAAAALKDPRAQVPFALERDRDKVVALQDLLDLNPELVPDVSGHVRSPGRAFVDGQSAIKVGTTLAGVDMSLSYYNGRHDIPTPTAVTSQPKAAREGEGEGCCYTSRATLVYPRMQVVGFDFATQVPFLNNLGLWGESALFIPQAKDLRIELPIAWDVTPDDGDPSTVTEIEGPSIRSTPYVKATAGFDYTFGEHVYVQFQYLRGFIDEFGADFIGNYLVGGTDLVFFGRHLIVRLFGVADLPTGRGDNASGVIYPELIMTPPWGSLTFNLGSFVLLGERDTKFGQPAAGTSIVFFKATGVF